MVLGNLCIIIAKFCVKIPTEDLSWLL